MSFADAYRKKAAELRAIAAFDTSPSRRITFERLARAFLLLAAQADRNSATDLVYETHPPPGDGGHTTRTA
jgi:hypothetical protein